MTDRLPSKDVWHSHERWRQQVERRLNEACAMVKGANAAQADRIADVIEMIAALTKDVEAIRER